MSHLDPGHHGVPLAEEHNDGDTAEDDAGLDNTAKDDAGLDNTAEEGAGGDDAAAAWDDAPLDPDDAMSPFLTRRSLHSQRVLRTRRRHRRTIVMIITLAAFAAVVLFAISFVRPLLGLDSVDDYPGPGHGSATVTIVPGQATRAIGEELVDKDIVATVDAFVDALEANTDDGAVQPGKYQLKKKMSAQGALAGLLDRSESAVHYAAVRQGLRQNAVLDLLAESTGSPRSEFATLADNPQQFGLPKQAPSLEGYLAPGEYRFPIGASPTDIISTMVDRTFDNLKKAGVHGEQHQYRILTLASIIEAEAAKADYRKVSGAIHNRLHKNNKETGGRIESDATVTYGLGRNSYQITNKEKRDKSNPYNTYAHTGLPIGPIGSPGVKAIKAAEHPAKVPYFYWVTVNLDTGETKFAKTYEQHQKNVKQYRHWCNKHEGRCK